MRHTLAASLLALMTLPCACGGGGTPTDRPPGAGTAGGGGADGGGVSGEGGSGIIGGAGTSIIARGTGGQSTCDPATSTTGCRRVAPDACGDGKLKEGEQCDDGNSLPGDGCSGICMREPYFECPTLGQPCVSTIVCGDGKVGPGEACDDGNKVAGDGCNATCSQVEKGFVCRTAAAPCTRIYLCGDGQVDPNEGCDDGNAQDGDGCNTRCRIEAGFKCAGSPSVCTATKCGDGVLEGAESCDDGNLIPFDGCSATCQAEPNCPKTGSCASKCGDGIVLGADEECDDGNLRDGDGCSSTCKIESGFTCANTAPCEEVEGKCTMTVAAVFRDFNFNMSANGHPDFQPGAPSGMAVAEGLVQDTWDDDKKPILTTGKATCVSTNGAKTACDPLQAYIHGAAGFAQWYRDKAPAGGPIPGTIRLWDNGKDGYVNRFGAKGEQWVGYPQNVVNGVTYPNPTWCAESSCDDPRCATPPAGTECIAPCIPNNATYACFAAKVLYDGNPLFFPIDPPTAGILTDARRSAKIPEQYGYNGWPWEADVADKLGLTPSGVKCDSTDQNAGTSTCHNFSFTTEVKYWFKYDATSTAKLDFTGDDDVWVFVNGKLAVDLGGWHVPLDGSVTINATTASKFGLADGQVYEIGVFQAERETEGSTFRLTLSGFNMTPSECGTACGDSVVVPPEQCDDGATENTGAYNHCTPSCTLGPRCGDTIKQDAEGEECDNGINDGAYGGCSADCKIGPHCGDAIVQPDYEQCDDGTNAGAYGQCGQNCKTGPYCGDRIVQEPNEECDDGNDSSGDGCSDCKREIYVPN